MSTYHLYLFYIVLLEISFHTISANKSRKKIPHFYSYKVFKRKILDKLRIVERAEPDSFDPDTPAEVENKPVHCRRIRGSAGNGKPFFWYTCNHRRDEKSRASSDSI